ncbi:MAG TPA: hypothetical protein VGK74_04645 [Symbiobacteriaceae bacterium]|jgi:alpha-tubulin suppressor-like RCC1 family protein
MRRRTLSRLLCLVLLWGLTASSAQALGPILPTVPQLPTSGSVADTPSAKAAQVAAGGGYSMAVDTSGKLWLWGEKPMGYDVTLINPTATHQHIRSASAGAAGLAITTGGFVVTGSHRQLFGLETLAQVAAVASSPPSGWGLGDVQRRGLVAVLSDGSVWAAQAEAVLEKGTATAAGATVPGFPTPSNPFGSTTSGDTTTYTYNGNSGLVAGLPAISKVAAASENLLALELSGGLWAWDWSALPLAAASSPATWHPTPVRIMTDVKEIATADHLWIALKKDGSVWQWQFPVFGQTSASATGLPVQVPGLAGVTAVAVGQDHSLAVKADGSVWAWGENTSGQLGDGTRSARTAPVKVPGLTGIATVAAGRDHSLALASDGTIWGWGRNEKGAVGDGTQLDRLQPVKVTLTEPASPVGEPTLGAFQTDGADTVAAGGNFSIALKPDGSVWQWGKVGAGSPGPQPAEVAGLSGVTAVAAGSSLAAALKSDGSVWVWGSVEADLLGEGHTTKADTPSRVPSLSGVQSIAAGAQGLVALKTDGSVWASHAIAKEVPSQVGGLFGGLDTSLEWSPGVVPGLSNGYQVAAGGNFFLVVKKDGTVWTWGSNWCNNAPGTEAALLKTPVRVTGLPPVTTVAAGTCHALALRNDGTVWAWGIGTSGELGDGVIHTASASPITGTSSGLGVKQGNPVPADYPTPVIGVWDVKMVAAGDRFSLAVGSDGSLWTWGRGDTGQLGTGLSENIPLRAPVFGLPKIGTAQAGGGHMVAVSTRGTVFAWGYNGTGQVGDGTFDTRREPVRIAVAATGTTPTGPTTPGTAQSTTATLRLAQSASSSELGGTFTVEVSVEKAKEVVGVDFLMTFPAGVLEVVPPYADLAVTGSKTLEGLVGANRFDNTAGTIRYATAKKAPGVTGGGLLGTVTFRRLRSGPAGIALKESTSLPRILDGQLHPLVPVVGPAVTNLFSGDSTKGAIMGQILLSNPYGKPDGTIVSLGDLTAVTDAKGQFKLAGIASGTYPLTYRHEHYASCVVRVVVEAGAVTQVGPVTLAAGDFDGDDAVGLSDLGRLAQMDGQSVYGKDATDALADLNGSNYVDAKDLEIFVVHYGAEGGEDPTGATLPLLDAPLPGVPGGQQGTFKPSPLPTLPAPAGKVTVTMDVPAKAAPGSEFDVRATIVNHTAGATKFSVSIDAPDDVTLVDPTGVTITTVGIARGGSVTISWTVKAADTGSHEFVISAAAADAAQGSGSAKATVVITQ